MIFKHREQRGPFGQIFSHDAMKHPYVFVAYIQIKYLLHNLPGRVQDLLLDSERNFRMGSIRYRIYRSHLGHPPRKLRTTPIFYGPQWQETQVYHLFTALLSWIPKWVRALDNKHIRPSQRELFKQYHISKHAQPGSCPRWKNSAGTSLGSGTGFLRPL